MVESARRTDLCASRAHGGLEVGSERPSSSGVSDRHGPRRHRPSGRINYWHYRPTLSANEFDSHGRVTRGSLLAPQGVTWSRQSSDVVRGRHSRCYSIPTQALDLPADERYLAGIRGLKRRYSSTLTRGVAQGFALLGAMGEELLLEEHTTISEMTSHAVRDLLRSAVSDGTGRHLHLLAPSLPLLAESAPQEFLAAINDSLDDPAPVVLTLFQEVEDSHALGPSSPHPHLLWALETLCWSQEYLVEAVRTLARLAAREPGGKSGNRPASSLSTVLTGWVRHTAADFDTRISAVDAALNTDEEVGWKLLKDLWPEITPGPCHRHPHDSGRSGRRLSPLSRSASGWSSYANSSIAQSTVLAPLPAT